MNIVITGAAGALGRAVTREFADAGARVALVDRIEGAACDRGAWFLATDLADGETARAALAKAASFLGEVDALVHLAGGFAWTPIAEAGIDQWRSLYSVNVETAVSCVRATLPYLRDGGAIVTVGAASAQPAGVGMAPYVAAKSGVARFTESLAKELSARRIRANCILPLIIDTPANRAEMPDADPSLWTSPEAIAGTIRFLASEHSRAINGASIEVTNAG